ncbi:MAG: phage tail assembly chaperone, partial [Pseudomonadota bacterium]|nr:phage tail assembly chaperone [Pseudomonadota bacterium]
TQNPDVPDATKAKWQAYRQALRDVPSQSDPYNITWPTKPS